MKEASPLRDQLEWVRGGSFKKLIAQDDDIFIRLAEQTVLVSAVVPDPSFAEKIETRAMYNFGVQTQSVRPKEYG
jgi:hypothetical protein